MRLSETVDYDCSTPVQQREIVFTNTDRTLSVWRLRASTCLAAKGAGLGWELAATLRLLLRSRPGAVSKVSLYCLLLTEVERGANPWPHVTRLGVCGL